MTQKTAFWVVTCAALLVMVASARPSVNTYVGHATPNHNSTWADGGYPIPPIPPGTGSGNLSVTSKLLADGGYPIPPIPPGTGSGSNLASSTLLADGGYPIPPIPPGTGSGSSLSPYSA